MPVQVEEQYFVNTLEGHNKFWIVSTDPNKPVMLVRNGRLGTNGQKQKPIDYHSTWNLTSKMADKVREKLDKGYQRVNRKQFELLSTQAAIVGSQNKCEDLVWVERVGNRSSDQAMFKPVPEDRLSDPGYDPILLVRVKTRKEIDGATEFTLLFTPEGCQELTLSMQNVRSTGFSHVTYLGVLNPVRSSSPLGELSAKVEAAMGRVYA